MKELPFAIISGLLISTVSFLSGNSATQSIGVSLVVVSAILLGIDMLGFGKYKEELKRLTAGGLWVDELEIVSGKDLDGDDKIGSGKND